MDGLVYPDRTPHTGLKEYKNIYRPARVLHYDQETGDMVLHNYMNYVDLKDYIYPVSYTHLDVYKRQVGYGSGDVAGNVVYAFLSTFVMLYLTNTVGLNPGIVGTLIAVSKLFDGVTDIFFGSMIDKTKTKMGKAKPWMLYGYIGCAVTLIGVFAIPESLGQTAQYAWFFIAYSLLNAVFYTANKMCIRDSNWREPKWHSQ